MLFNFEEQQINPAESTNNFSPLCVLVFLSKLVDESRLRNRVYTTESVTPNAHAHAGEGGGMPPFEVDMTDVNHNGVPDVFEK